jgi:tetratricopeptide (TPR) repeat protein
MISRRAIAWKSVMSGKHIDHRDREERREDLLRPNPYMGYYRDDIAMHLVDREAYEIAESQFRRAIWLNPFEPRFKVHLAWCLYKQGRDADARACLSEVPEADMDDDMRTMAKLIRQSPAEKPEGENR